MSSESSGTTAVDSTLSPRLPLSNLVALAAGCSSRIVVGADPEVILDLSLHIQLTGIPVVSACFQLSKNLFTPLLICPKPGPQPPLSPLELWQDLPCGIPACTLRHTVFSLAQTVCCSWPSYSIRAE